MRGNPVHDGCHAVLADAVTHVAAVLGGWSEILDPVNVVERGAVKIGAAGNRQRKLGGDGLEYIGAGFACGDFGVRREMRNDGEQLLRGGEISLDTFIEDGG